MRMIVGLILVCLGVLMVGRGVVAADAAKGGAKPQAALPLDVTMQTLDGKDVNLAKKYKGKVVLLVNVASKCGLTPQYKPLQELHAKYARTGWRSSACRATSSTIRSRARRKRFRSSAGRITASSSTCWERWK